MEEETERVAVTTYVPAYQREEWRAHAERLGVSQSEFVRTMVQAGRRGFDLDANPVEPDDRDVTPGGGGLKTRIEGILREEGPLEWDELVGELTDDVEERLDSALSELQGEDRVRHSGRGGGYTVVGATDGG